MNAKPRRRPAASPAQLSLFSTAELPAPSRLERAVTKMLLLADKDETRRVPLSLVAVYAAGLALLLLQLKSLL